MIYFYEILSEFKTFNLTFFSPSDSVVIYIKNYHLS